MCLALIRFLYMGTIVNSIFLRGTLQWILGLQARPTPLPAEGSSRGTAAIDWAFFIPLHEPNPRYGKGFHPRLVHFCSHRKPSFWVCLGGVLNSCPSVCDAFVTACYGFSYGLTRLSLLEGDRCVSG